MHMKKMRRKSKLYQTILPNLYSLGGSVDAPKYEIVVTDEEADSHRNINLQPEGLHYQRARVLCSYDAKDNSELNLVANEVSY